MLNAHTVLSSQIFWKTGCRRFQSGASLCRETARTGTRARMCGEHKGQPGPPHTADRDPKKMEGGRRHTLRFLNPLWSLRIVAALLHQIGKRAKLESSIVALFVWNRWLGSRVVPHGEKPLPMPVGLEFLTSDDDACLSDRETSSSPRLCQPPLQKIWEILTCLTTPFTNPIQWSSGQTNR